MGGQPGSWIDNSDIDELLETGELTIHKGRQSDNAGYKFDQHSTHRHPITDFITGLADVNMDAAGAGSIPTVLGAMAVSKLGLKTHYSSQSSGSDAKDAQDSPPMPWKVTFPINLDINENLSNWRNRILIETDAPDLLPHGLDSRLNEPANLLHVLNRASELMNLSSAMLAEQTYINACRFFNIENYDSLK